MTWSAVAGAWEWRPDVLAALCIVSLVYVRGWVILRRRGFPKVASGVRLAASLAGWGIVGAALLSPLDLLQRRLLSAHMVQHELLMVAGPPLILAGRPVPVAFWGLPADVRTWAGRAGRPRGPARGAFDLLTAPLPAWLVSTGILWTWHVPAVYNAVESNGMLHNAQHLCFLVAGLLFWWPVIGAPPRTRSLSLPALSAYLLAGMTQRSLLGALITLSRRVLYPHYAAVRGIGAAAALDDQHVAGAVMWFGSGIVLLAITLGAIWRAPAPRLPAEIFSDEAPGAAGAPAVEPAPAAAEVRPAGPAAGSG